jgi:N-acetylmuramoyl-L-alanine amidase
MSDIDILARTIYGEARGESWQGKLAVGWVIKNRADAAVQGKSRKLFGNGTISSACKVPYQFSCWNENDRNKTLISNISLETDGHFRECYAAAAAVMFNYIDPTLGANHYYARSIAAPKWAIDQTPIATIGNHIFYKL